MNLPLVHGFEQSHDIRGFDSPGQQFLHEEFGFRPREWVPALSFLDQR
jgi:hypothetical protein